MEGIGRGELTRGNSPGVNFTYMHLRVVPCFAMYARTETFFTFKLYLNKQSISKLCRI